MRAGLPIAIRVRREALQLTQRQAAQRMGLGDHSWYGWAKYEQGRSDPSLRTFEKIAAALELTPVQLAELATKHSERLAGGRFLAS